MSWHFETRDQAPPPIAALYLLIGSLQGGALWFLHEASQVGSWPATEATAFRPLLAMAIFVPAVLLMGIGFIRPKSLTLWAVVTAILSAGLSLHSAFREGLTQNYSYTSLDQSAFYFFLAGLFLVGHALVAAGDADRKWLADFPTYFDVSWRRATQLALAGVFVGLFWAVLWLGSELFGLIGVEIFATIIGKSWFWIPATTLTTAAALLLTSWRVAMIRGARILMLGLLSWLMPLMVSIGLGFLLALPFTGLDLLWNTRHATASLLSAAAVLILLINSHFQDGGPESRRVGLLVYARLAAAVMLAPLTVLAAIGLAMRVGQHGWTTSRIAALACLIVVGCHAVGYAIAALRSGAALRGLATTNVLSALATVAIAIALLTPIADPARLSVADQVNRLVAGRVTPDKFDFRLLRFETARYGWEALQRLKSTQDGPNAPQIAARAAQALDRNFPRHESSWPLEEPTESSRIENIAVVYPAGQSLPESFVRQDWNVGRRPDWVPRCLVTARQKCKAILLDVDGDGVLEVILVDDDYAGRTMVIRRGTDGLWTLMGMINDVSCPGVRDALRSGRFELAPAQHMDILAAGHRLRFVPRCYPTARP